MCSKSKIKLCLITKNRFFLKEKTLITNGFLFYQDIGILGFRLNEIEKLIFIGFNEEKEFYGYKYELNEIENVFIIGPKFREERRYILDRLINIFSTLVEIFKKRKILKDVDLVFASFFEYVVFEFLILKFICRKAKFINYIIGDYPERNYLKKKNFLFKMILSLFQKITGYVADSNWFIAKKLYIKYPLPRSKVIYNSSLKEHFVINTPKSSNIYNYKLCFVGRLEFDKNPLMLLEILKKLKEKNLNINLTIIGDGPLREEFLKKIYDLNLKENIILKGWIVDREEYFKALASCDTLLLTSIEGEGTPLVILEAFACGLPVIVTDSGGTSEIVSDGVNGYLINIEEKNKMIEDFVKKIEFLIFNPQIYTKISQNNIQKAKEWTIETLSKIQRKEILKLLNKYE